MPTLPKLVSYLWGFFLDIHKQRANNGFGPSPIAFTEIKAWMELYRQKLKPWEIRAILAIDEKYLIAVANSKGKKENG